MCVCVFLKVSFTATCNIGPLREGLVPSGVYV